MASSDRDRAGLLTQTVIDEFQRSGTLPLELVRDIQAAHARRKGGIIPLEVVEREARLYVERLLTKIDAARPVVHDDGAIDRAVDILMCFTPSAKPKEWAEATAIVEQAWKEGRLTPAQVAQLDALNTIYEAS
jgi:hypothetical protein